MRTRSTLIPGILFAVILCALPRPAAAGCPEVLAFLADKAIGATCVHADDLRVPSFQLSPVPPAIATGGVPPVLPGNNSITKFADGTSLPGILSGNGSFTPVTDLTVISNGPTPAVDPTTNKVPGIQVEGWFADDPAGEARFQMRFPDDWNGKLVVAGASGTRSEFNGDWAWSDYVLPKGYAYASQNKGVLNLFIIAIQLPPISTGSATQPASDSFSCRLNPTSTTWVHFYDNDVLVADYPSVVKDRLKPFTQWTRYMLEDARLAHGALKANFNHFPRRTYAVGTSNGGYQVRRAMEEGPDLFDGGVDWEGTFIDVRENILETLPPAIENFPAYVASGFDPTSMAAQNIVKAGYPPDIVNATKTDSLWLHYSNSFWEVTQCQWQKRFDPSWVTYPGGPNDVDGTGGYNYLDRLEDGFVDVRQLERSETTGKIKRPLITVAGTMDALLPIKKQARAYEDRVLDSRKHHHEEDCDHDCDDHRDAAYRLYEVQNGNHIEAYALIFSQLQLIQPHAQKAFDLLVDYVEHHEELPPSQCIPQGGSIVEHPTQPGHCAQLLAP